MAEQANGGTDTEQSKAGLLLTALLSKLFPRHTAVKREQESALKFFQHWYSHPATINRMQEQGYSDEDVSNINKSIQTFGQMKVEKELGPVIGAIQRLPKHAKDKIIYDIGTPVPLFKDWLGYQEGTHIGISQIGRESLKSPLDVAFGREVVGKKMTQPELRSVLTHEVEHLVDPRVEQKAYAGPNEKRIRSFAEWASNNPEEATREYFPHLEGLGNKMSDPDVWAAWIKQSLRGESAGPILFFEGAKNMPLMSTEEQFINTLSEWEGGRFSEQEGTEFYQYQKKPTEIRARAMEVRRYLVDKGIIDPGTKITTKHLREIGGHKALQKLDALFPGSDNPQARKPNQFFKGVAKLLNIIAGMEPQQTEAEGVFA